MKDWKRKIKAFIEQDLKVVSNAKILVAVSGGKDSVLLLHVLHALGYDVAIAHVNFCLRGEESNQDANFVHSLAKEIGVSFHLKKENTSTFAKRNSLSIQEAAREIRYKWFRQLCENDGYDFVAVAHHKNDVLETQLMHLMRGSGIRGLRSIKAKNGHVLRPLLCLNSDEVEDLIRHFKLKYREDSSNGTDAYLRNRVRHHVIPELVKCREDVVDQAAFSARLLEKSEALIDELMEEKRSQLFKTNRKEVVSVAIADLDQRSDGFLYELLRPYGGFSISELQSLFKADTGRLLENDDYTILKNREELLIKRSQKAQKEVLLIEEGVDLVNVGINISIQIIDGSVPKEAFNDTNSCVVPASKLRFPLKLRRWVEGDKMRPFGMKGSKLVSDVLTDMKLSRFEKEEVYVLSSENELFWLVGYRTSEDFKVVDENEKLYLFTLNSNPDE